jgi:hypothetical protein
VPLAVAAGDDVDYNAPPRGALGPSSFAPAVTSAVATVATSSFITVSSPSKPVVPSKPPVPSKLSRPLRPSVALTLSPRLLRAQSVAVTQTTTSLSGPVMSSSSFGVSSLTAPG